MLTLKPADFLSLFLSVTCTTTVAIAWQTVDPEVCGLRFHLP